MYKQKSEKLELFSRALEACFLLLLFMVPYMKNIFFFLSKHSLLIIISIDIDTAMLQQKLAQLSLCPSLPLIL